MENFVLPQKVNAWKKYINSGKIDFNVVRSPIVESWLKCAKDGVNPEDGRGHNVLEYYKLKALVEENQELIDIVEPYMKNLYNVLGKSKFIIVLTDAQGYVLQSFGDWDVIEDAQILDFIPGACWREEDVGTNAIGTALRVARPIQVVGPEHFCVTHHSWTCSAVPVFDENNRTIAILDISGPVQAIHAHTLGMVIAAAEAITMKMRIQRKNAELGNVTKHMDLILNSTSNGIIVVDKFGNVNNINQVGRQITSGLKDEVIGKPFNSLFCSERTSNHETLFISELYSNNELAVKEKFGSNRYMASGTPITDEKGGETGGIIILRHVNEVDSKGSQLSGNSAKFKFCDILGESKAITETISIAMHAAKSLSNILLHGESGTGKELFAQAIHNQSNRAAGPFVAVNCGAIPKELIGSELFGYVGGAFTGAKRDGSPGKFEMACGGTIFLDEIGDMPFEQQVALLRVLQEKRVIRIGSSKVVPVDVRIICATNKDLMKEVEKGTFRKDLYYRLNVISITVPPLRDRREDIILLAKSFIKKFAGEPGKRFDMDPEAVSCLIEYNWPGNVRELQNVIERMVNLADEERIGISQLPAEILNCSLSKPEPQELTIGENKRERRELFAENERNRILACLGKHGGNVSSTAKELEISRNTLYRKMHLLGIEN